MTDKPAGHYDIAIVVLTFNNAPTIASCLQSICNQEYPRESFRIVVLDNGSTDATLDIVRSFGIDCCVLPGFTLGQLRNEVCSALMPLSLVSSTRIAR